MENLKIVLAGPGLGLEHVLQGHLPDAPPWRVSPFE